MDDRTPVRWRLLVVPAATLWVVAGAGLAWVWSKHTVQRQDQVVPTLIGSALIGIVTVAWLVLWTLAFSRLPWRLRLATVALLGLALTGLALSVRVRGFTGDIVPVLGWRWSSGGAAGLRGAGETPAISAPGAVASLDYPQFLGPQRDGALRGVRLARDWSEAPPRLLWRRPVGPGWSGFAVADGLAVTQEQRDDEELVTAYDLQTGQPTWSHSDAARWEDPIGGPGPRATACIHAGSVFALGATGILNALDLGTGARLWSHDVAKDRGVDVPPYGISASPLVVDDLVVVAVGGRGAALVAYDVRTGREAWAKGDGPGAYGSPRLADLAGTPQILLLGGGNLAAHAPADGRVLWEHGWPVGERAFTPLVLPGDRVFVSAGYGVGGKLFRVRRAESASHSAGLAVDLLWETAALRAKFTNVVEHDGFLYGLDDGILVCLDSRDGTRRWKQGRYGHGQVILAGDSIVVMAETGDVALVRASPDGFHEWGSFPALDGKTWNAPALAWPYLVVRNDREAACFELISEQG